MRPKPLTNPQRRLMFALIKYLGWDIDDLRDLVESLTGQRHISALTVESGGRVISDLKQLIQERRGNRPGPTPKQVKKIMKLGYILGWNSRTIRKFNQRTTGNWDVYDNLPPDASKLISAMEAVIRDEKARAQRA